MIINPSDRLSGVGEYYFSSKLKEVAKLNKEGENIINLGIGSPDLAPDSGVTEALVSDLDDPKAHGYQPYQGIAELRESISDFYQRHFQVQINPANEVLPLIGSKEGIMHISLAYLNTGDRVLVPDLGYPTYTSVSKLAQAEIVYYPLLEEKNWEPDWDALRNAVSAKTKIIWLNYPHMPTGAKGSLEILSRFVELALDKGVLLVNDNPYSFIRNEKPLSIFQVPEAKTVAIELNSMSKTFNMAGWRIGWACGSAELLDPVLKVKSNMDSGMFRPLQKAAVAALGARDDWFDALNDEYRKREKIGRKILDEAGCIYSENQAGLFIWAKTQNLNGEDLCDKLLYEKGIFVTPGKIFGEKGHDFIRLSLCQSQEILTAALNRLK